MADKKSKWDSIAICSDPDCEMQRYFETPEEVPDPWYCHEHVNSRLVAVIRELIDQVESDHTNLIGDDAGLVDSTDVLGLLEQARAVLDIAK